MPTNDVAVRVLLPGDPGRALALATALLDKPLMANHARGLWGYTGNALADGAPLTIQSAGVGGPSAAAVVQDLALLGVTSLVRVGTCVTAAPGPVLRVADALPLDGTSRALGASGPVPAALAGDAHVASRDLWSGDVPDGCAAADLSTAAVLQAARRTGIAAGAVLAPAPLTDDDLAALGAAGLDLLLAAPVPA